MLEDIQGQSEGVQYLRRVVEGRLVTPLLLVGDAGVGKRYSVIETAKEVFKEGSSEDCPQCYQIDRGIHPDLRIVQPEEGKDIKVEVIRNLIEEAVTKPSRAPLKFLVVDGADRLTTASANALLKVLEEAPELVRFFLLAEDRHRILPTIRSRCAEIRYRRLPESFVVEKLLGHTDDPAKALVYCRLADGSVGRAIKFLGVGRLGLRDRILGLLKTAVSGDLSQLFSGVDALGKDLVLGIRFLEHILHDLIMLPHDPSRLTNLDAIEILSGLRPAIGEQRLSKLRFELKGVSSLSRGPYNLSFHVKTMLASAFA